MQRRRNAASRSTGAPHPPQAAASFESGDDVAVDSSAHAIRNHLAAAMANVEAFLDGTLKPNPDRLRVVMDALSRIGPIVDDVARLHRDVAPRRARDVDGEQA